MEGDFCFSHGQPGEPVDENHNFEFTAHASIPACDQVNLLLLLLFSCDIYHLLTAVSNLQHPYNNGDRFEVSMQELLQGCDGMEQDHTDVEEVDGTSFPTKDKGKGNCKRGKAFLPEEDIIICSAWLNIGKDPIIGTAILLFGHSQ